MAPGAQLVCLKVLDQRGNGYVSDVLAGLRWVRQNGSQYGIRIINISVGSFTPKGMSEDSALVRGVDAAWDAGYVVVVAAGNNGPAAHTITTPGISRKVITVGCADDDREVEVAGSRMVDYSGRGPTDACICKPDIVAPGSRIVSCNLRRNGYRFKAGRPCLRRLSRGGGASAGAESDMTNRDVKLRFKERAVDLGCRATNRAGGAGYRAAVRVEAGRCQMTCTGRHFCNGRFCVNSNGG